MVMVIRWETAKITVKRTVVAYQNPFTGDYCIRKSRVGAKGYINEAQIPNSPDSGLSDEYEPLQLDPQVPQAVIPDEVFSTPTVDKIGDVPVMERQCDATVGDNRVNKTWNWNYKEYQI
ncbi:hypothetical protein ACJJTC_012082 [Scirpophaga incertulas]